MTTATETKPCTWTKWDGEWCVRVPAGIVPPVISPACARAWADHLRSEGEQVVVRGSEIYVL